MPVKLRQLGLQPSQVGAHRSPDHGLGRTPQAVALGVDLLRQLAPAEHQGLQARLRHAQRRVGRGLGQRAIAREQRGVEAIGLGEPAEALGELAGLPRADHRDGDPGGVQEPRRGPLEPAGRLHHHQGRRLRGHQVGQRLPALGLLGEAPPHRLRQDTDLEPVLADIDADTTLEFLPHPLAPCHVCGVSDGQVGPRSTVQVDDRCGWAPCRHPGFSRLLSGRQTSGVPPALRLRCAASMPRTLPRPLHPTQDTRNLFILSGAFDSAEQ
jgi:hypothetical protein